MKSTILARLFALLIVAYCASIGQSTASLNSSALAAQHTSTTPEHEGYYTVINLGTFGGSNSNAASINEIGWVTGSANLAGDQYSEAALWRYGRKQRLGTLGGPNSGVNWPNHNNFGLVAGISETPQVDPLAEDWSCQGFFPTVPDTKHVCLGFAWRDGMMHALRTLGGINGYAAGTNNAGRIAGWAETTVHDPTCTAMTHVAGFYQVLQFEPVVWERNGHPMQLPTLPGDPDGAATAINDRGEIVGISGTCDQAVGRFTAAHAVLWKNGMVKNIGNFGGISWNTPTAINNRGEIAGFANLPGDAKGQFQPIGFIWTTSGGLTKISPLLGDTNSIANGVNARGQVVGLSFNVTTGAQRAILWERGKTMDLNSFLPANSSLYLLSADDIDDRGDIVGQALVQGTSHQPAFVAIPPHDWDPATATPLQPARASAAVPAGVHQQFLRRFGVAAPRPN